MRSSMSSQMPSQTPSQLPSQTTSKPPSRWDCLADIHPDAGPSRQNRRLPTNRVKISEPEKWVKDNSSTYIPKPDVKDTSLFPSLGTSPTKSVSLQDYSLLNLPQESTSEHGAAPAEKRMVNIRECIASRKKEAMEPDPYISYKMFDAIEEMKARWYLHDFLQGDYVDYDRCIPDVEGIDGWETPSDSEDSDLDSDDYDSM